MRWVVRTTKHLLRNRLSMNQGRVPEWLMGQPRISKLMTSVAQVRVLSLSNFFFSLSPRAEVFFFFARRFFDSQSYINLCSDLVYVAADNLFVQLYLFYIHPSWVVVAQGQRLKILNVSLGEINGWLNVLSACVEAWPVSHSVAMPWMCVWACDGGGMHCSWYFHLHANGMTDK